MRLVQYATATGMTSAVMLDADHCAPLPAGLDLAAVLAMPAPERAAALERPGPPLALADLELTPLLSPASAVWALALNYDSHVSEGGHARPDHPMLFLRLPASFAGHDRALVKPAGTIQFDYEGELAVFIGKRGVDIAADDANDHIGGYACCNEGSVREWQRHTSQITPGKNFWQSAAIGPWLQLADDHYDPGAATLRTTVNGQQVQQARIDEMLFSVAEAIAYISTITPLNPGDVILMGTPGGVGFRRDPQLFLNAGDEVCVEIEGLGLLRNTVRDR